jgi:hypothetical protein
MASTYPLSIVDDRALPSGYAGNAFVWDVDKTYLATRFSSVKHLARIPLEFAVDKRAIPGMPEVLRGLRRGPGPGYACAPLYFVSASPPQLRRVLERKMLLDGVEWDGIILKDWAAALQQLRPGRLKEQVGFKVCALLTGRLSRPRATEYLFGDDVEADALAYSLYARLVSGELPALSCDEELRRAGVMADDRRCIAALAERLSERGRVAKAFIHLEHGSDPRMFDRFAGLVGAVHGAYQLALALFELGLVDERTVREAGQAQRLVARFGPLNLDDLEVDAKARGLVSDATLTRLRTAAAAG